VAGASDQQMALVGLSISAPKDPNPPISTDQAVSAAQSRAGDLPVLSVTLASCTQADIATQDCYVVSLDPSGQTIRPQGTLLTETGSDKPQPMTIDAVLVDSHTGEVIIAWQHADPS